MEPETYLLIAILMVVVAAIVILVRYILATLEEIYSEAEAEKRFNDGWSKWGDITRLGEAKNE